MSKEQVVESADTVIPWWESYLISSRGKLLFCQRWKPKTELKGIIFLSHGYAEHSGYYKDLALELAKDSYYVVTHDHTGHGRSEGVRAHVNEMNDYVIDVFQHIDYVRLKHNQLPTFIVGHSMGGTIAIKAAMQRPTFFQGVVLVAPGIALNPNEATPIKVILAKIISKVAPTCSVASLNLKDVARDPEMVEFMKRDNLRYHGGVRARWGIVFMAALHEIQVNLSSVEWPFLVLHGSSDRITDLSGSKMLYNLSASRDKSIKIYKDAYHNLLHDTEEVKKMTLNDIHTWINTRVKSLIKSEATDEMAAAN